MRRPAIVIALVVVAATVIFLWMKRGTDADSKSQTAKHAPNGDETRNAAKGPGARSDEPARNNATPRRPLRKGVRKMKAKEDRLRLLRAIKAAQLERQRKADDNTGERTADTTPPPVPRPDGKLDKEYIREVIKGSIGLLKECYELARDKAPSVEGKVTVEFTIVGEEEVGGLVESAKILSDNDLSNNKTMSECMTQTMLSLEYAAPENGGKVMVRYPFVFRNAAPEKK